MKFTEEHKQKIRESNINYWKNKIRIPWNKGKKCPEISLKMKGNKNGSGNKGRKLSEQVKEKISITLTGRKNSEHSARMKGRPAWNKGKNRYWYTDGSFKKGGTTGIKNVNWKGDSVGYSGLHSWVKRYLGRPMVCDHCKKIVKNPKQIHWANKNHKY